MFAPREAPLDNERTEKPLQEENELKSEEFAYVERTQFTSEAFKIEIGNIPKFFGFGECKKLLKNTLKLHPHKIKHVPRVKKIYVKFKNEQDKAEALEKLHQYEYKHCVLSVKSAKPKADAMAVKRENTTEKTSETEEKKIKLEPNKEEIISSKEMLMQSVTKWHNLPYEQQLMKKFANMKDVLIKLRQKMGKINLDNEVFVWIMKHKNEVGGMCCPLKPILPSPVTQSYRNKSEFTVGVDTGGERAVGYRLGKYRDQTCAVESADCISVLPEKMKLVASKFQEYVKQSDKEPYNPQNYEGHWRQLTVRTTIDGQVMGIVIVCDKGQGDEDIAREKKAIEEFFKSSPNEDLVSTLLYQAIPTHQQSGKEVDPPAVVFGLGHIEETLMGQKFQISPDAFFQCNTLAAEVLYSSIRDLIKADSTDDSNSSRTQKPETTEKNVILFDICCGTGTIGLTLASSVMKVIGIELCQQAVEDAKKNTYKNGIKNAEFHCGKAEDLLPNIIKNYSSSKYEIKAIVDPPRPGIHGRVIQSLRRCTALKEIIYVSCNPNACINNFFDLCRPMSKRMPGLPFLPLVAQPVDLFPQTPHCELIVVFKRVTGVKAKENVDSAKPDELENTEDVAGE